MLTFHWWYIEQGSHQLDYKSNLVQFLSKGCQPAFEECLQSTKFSKLFGGMGTYDFNGHGKILAQHLWISLYDPREGKIHVS